ncbi:major facilitator superfamily domain-containing protein [Yarrowia lipolytica]|jgi:MFS family permease|uniref:YALI0E27159p n=2 Tax=Yarrowia lipolytica TaxID=4952 RepID=Q6C4F7_YARLI|nr:YALI0E27159p [Yarrowia lipolytica CLIB122]AOW06026.1 hypothetical protein YALI1_E32118g [Yarrowia lipolytica]KAB8281452.1 major facilitator superfamily domain-containing protein [Yarrowia lipolytica]KAE8175215.1 major facilitator superfamily domain-containing protein [Yarrowia lipolytica]KAJ8057429.1 major facilitator superfamily domain-containing protein [Yarrowia lipolytica]QNP99902.1 Putative MFS-type transporter [Yarrowia lipolytica]|eukprot:XP_504455.1 YALI0E27159p [Yarrowia lipolytica CLIB122]
MKVDSEVIPGTIQLVDLKGDPDYNAVDHEIVLVPTPSADPDDPLNWSQRRKWLSMLCMVLYTLGVGVPTASIFSVLLPISEKTNLSLADLNEGTGYMFLMLGFGCLFWQPVALQFGKRPVYLISILGTMAVQIWAPYTKNNGQWIGHKILQGFLGAPIESLCEVTVSDIWFEHERGSWMGLYAFMMLFGSFMAPFFGGFITQGMDWKWVLFWGAIFDAVVFVFLFFFFEETNYSRKAELERECMESETLDVAHGGAVLPVGSGSFNDSSDQNEKGSANRVDVIPNPFSNGETAACGVPAKIYKPKTFWDKLKLFDKPRPNMLWTMVKRPIIILFSFPPVIYAGFLYGTGLIWFSVLNATASKILSEPPYNFKPSMVGVAYLCPTIITAIVAWYGGWLGDRLRIWMAKRHGGISEAEDRLWLLALYMVMCPAGLILWGIGAAHGIHWFGLVMGLGITGGFGVLAGLCSVNYAVDCYREMASESMVPLIIIRNCMGFGMGYAITPWLTNEGLQRCFGEAAGVSVFCIGMFLFMIAFGKKFRIATRHRYWKFVQESIENDMAH